MTALGELLELLHNAHEHLSTLRAEYQDWTRPRPSLEVGRDPLAPDELRLSWRGAGPFTTSVVSTRRIWVQRQDALRVEMLRGPALQKLGVRHPERWWRWDAVRGVEMSEAPVDGRAWAIPALLSPLVLHPVELVAAMRFNPTGRRVHAGREVVCADATPRATRPVSATRSYELEFDAEHGTILRYAAFENDQTSAITDAVSVDYGSPIEPEKFVFAPPCGESAHGRAVATGG
jgi:hypothetical protein